MKIADTFMKIGLLFPSIYASPNLFPDKIFAPRELFTSLSNGLVERGHEVTVFSTPDVETKATITSSSLDLVKSPLPSSKVRGLSEEKRQILNTEFAKHAFELDSTSRPFHKAHEGALDILHVYHDSSLFMSHYMERVIHPFPTVYTLHDPLPPEGTYEYHEFSQFADHAYVAISNAFRQSSLPLTFIDTVYPGIPLDGYPFNPGPILDGLLLFG